MRPSPRPLTAVALAVSLLLAACSAPPAATPSPEPTPTPTTPLAVQPAATPPESESGPWYMGGEAGSTDARRLPLEVDSFGALFMDWNDQGDALAYIAGGDLWVWRNGVSTNLTVTDDRLEGLPRWSPDGRWIAFASRPFEADETPEALLGPQGGPSVIEADAPDEGYVVIATMALSAPPSWAPDSTRLAYASEGEVFTVDRAGTLLSQHSGAKAGIGDALTGVEWSPVADILAVSFVDGGGAVPAEGEWALMGYALIAENAVAVTEDERGLSIVMDWTAAYLPPPPVRWSPDGQSILIALPPVSGGIAADYPTGLWVAEPGVLQPFSGDPPRGPEPREVAGLRPYQAVWSPDGHWIAVVEDGDRRIVVLDAATLTVIAQPGPPSGIDGIAW